MGISLGQTKAGHNNEETIRHCKYAGIVYKILTDCHIFLTVVLESSSQTTTPVPEPSKLCNKLDF